MSRIKSLFRENKAMTAILLVGLCVGLLMLFAGRFLGQSAQVSTEPHTLPNTEASLNSGDSENYGDSESSGIESRMESILSLVENAGTVKVLVNYSQGPQTVVARNETSDSSVTSEQDANGGVREQSQTKTQDSVVTLRNQEGGDEPLILYEVPPEIEGVIIVAEGGGDIVVQDALIRAASSLLGISVHKVSVLKMTPNGL